MKVLAMIDVAAGADLQEVRKGLLDELRGSWRLFEEGTLREAYATSVPTRVVFVLEAESVAEAKRTLDALPLVHAGSVIVDYVELKPFVNWSLLFQH